VRPRAILGVCAAGVAVGWNSGNISAVAGSIADAYGVGLAVVGLMTTVLVATHSVLNLPAGKGADRFGSRRMVIFGLVVIVVINAVATIDSDPALVMTMRVLGGIGTASAFVAANDFVRAAGGSHLAQGAIGGAGLGGVGLALAVVPQLEDALGWRAAFVSAIAMAVVSVVLFAWSSSGILLQRPARRTHATDAPERDYDRVPLVRVTLVHMSSMGCALVAGAWVVTLLEREGGYSPRLAGLVGGQILITGIAGRPISGWFAGRWPQHTRSLLGGSLLVGAAGTALIATAPPAAVAAPAAAIVGFAAGVPYASVLFAVAKAHPEAPGAAVGRANMFGNGVSAAGTPLLGLAFAWPDGGRIGFFVVASLWAVSILALPNNRELRLPRSRLSADVDLRESRP
jgi:MFS family permease